MSVRNVTDTNPMKYVPSAPAPVAEEFSSRPRDVFYIAQAAPAATSASTGSWINDEVVKTIQAKKPDPVAYSQKENKGLVMLTGLEGGSIASRIRALAVIKAPIATVWGQVNDIDKWPEWIKSDDSEASMASSKAYKPNPNSTTEFHKFVLKVGAGTLHGKTKLKEHKGHPDYRIEWGEPQDIESGLLNAEHTYALKACKGRIQLYSLSNNETLIIYDGESEANIPEKSPDRDPGRIRLPLTKLAKGMLKNLAGAVGAGGLQAEIVNP